MNTNVAKFPTTGDLVEREEQSLRRHGFELPPRPAVTAEDSEEYKHTRRGQPPEQGD